MDQLQDYILSLTATSPKPVLIVVGDLDARIGPNDNTFVFKHAYSFDPNLGRFIDCCYFKRPLYKVSA